MIVSVTAEWGPGCAQVEDSALTLTVRATDPDGDDSQLVYSGDLMYCTPGVGPGAVSTLTGNSSSIVDGWITVMDPQENTDSLQVFFVMCEDSET